MQLTALSPQVLSLPSAFGNKRRRGQAIHNPEGGGYKSGQVLPCEDIEAANKLVSKISLAGKTATPSYQNGGWVVIVK